jgi:hypothetical protein
MKQHCTVQLRPLPDQSFDCHVIITGEDRNTPPVLRSYRNISLSSVERFYTLSEGYLTYYVDRERNHA